MVDFQRLRDQAVDLWLGNEPESQQPEEQSLVELVPEEESPPEPLDLEEIEQFSEPESPSTSETEGGLSMPEAQSFRILPSEEDTITVAKTKEFLTRLHDSVGNPQRKKKASFFGAISGSNERVALEAENFQTFSFQLLGDGSASESYPVFTCYNSNFVPMVQELLQSYFPNTQFEPEREVVPAFFGSGLTYQVDNTDLLIRAFTSFDPDPLVLFLNHMEHLGRGDKASFTVYFSPLVPTVAIELCNTFAYATYLNPEHSAYIPDAALKYDQTRSLWSVLVIVSADFENDPDRAQV